MKAMKTRILLVLLLVVTGQLSATDILKSDLDASIGITLIHMGDRAYFVDDVRDPSSAKEENIKRGDFVYSVNGTKCTGVSPEELLRLLSGPKGSSVCLVLVVQPFVIRQIYIARDSPTSLTVSDVQDMRDENNRPLLEGINRIRVIVAPKEIEPPASTRASSGERHSDRSEPSSTVKSTPPSGPGGARPPEAK